MNTKQTNRNNDKPKTKKYKLCSICLFFCCILLSSAVLFLLKRGNYFDILVSKMSDSSFNYLDNASYTQRETQFEMLPVQDVDVTFVGDSITARFEWQEYFTSFKVANRGIDSDVAEGVYNRLDTIINEKPEKIFLMIGINDIRQDIPMSDTLDYYTRILDELQKKLPNCKIYVQSVLPVNSSTGIDNRKVQTLNDKLKNLAAKYSMTYIDIYSSVINDKNDFTYTVDGVHPTGEGYQLWMDALSPYIN